MVEIKEDKDLVAITTETSSLVIKAEGLVINSEETLNVSAQMVSWIAKVRKKLEEKRNFFVKPLNDQVKRINAMFKEYSEPLVKADQIIRGKVITYRIEQEKARREEQEEMERLATEKGGEIEPVEVPALAPTVKTDFGTMATRKIWSFEIMNEYQIPRQYLAVDEKAIRQAIRDGVRNIPGINIFQKEELMVK